MVVFFQLLILKTSNDNFTISQPNNKVKHHGCHSDFLNACQLAFLNKEEISVFYSPIKTYKILKLFQYNFGHFSFEIRH